MMKDTTYKIIVRDTINWAKIPIEANMDNPKSKWNKVLTHREYLPEALKLLETTIEVKHTLDLYNESLKEFSQFSSWIFNDDVYTISKPNREYRISINGDFCMNHHVKDRVITKLYEFLIKSNVISGVSIEETLNCDYQCDNRGCNTRRKQESESAISNPRQFSKNILDYSILTAVRPRNEK